MTLLKSSATLYTLGAAAFAIDHPRVAAVPPPSEALTLSFFSFLPGIPASCHWSAATRRCRPNWSVIIISAFARGFFYDSQPSPSRVINNGAQARVLARQAERPVSAAPPRPPSQDTESTRPGISLCLSGYDQ